MTTEINPALGTGIGTVRILGQPRSSESARSECVLDHFRCPDTVLDFSLVQELSSVSGYFRFGNNVSCYGRSCRGDRDPHLGASGYEALNDIVTNDGTVCLPFDPDEVIDNLRLDR